MLIRAGGTSVSAQTAPYEDKMHNSDRFDTPKLASYINDASKICLVQLSVLNAKRRHKNKTSR